MEDLWQSLEQIEDINDRIRLIYDDVKTGRNKFKELAQIDVKLLAWHHFLEGNESSRKVQKWPKMAQM